MSHLPRTLILGLILLWFGTRGPTPGYAGNEGRIVLITSQDAVPYREAGEGFQRHLTQAGVTNPVVPYGLEGNAAKAAQVISEVRNSGARLLVTVGSLATQIALRDAGDLPLIACMVVDPEELQRAPNATGVVLDFPIATQLAWLQRLLPGHKAVGVLFNPKENRDKIAAAVEVARGQGLTLIARAVETPQALPDALDSLAKEADVLWGVTDTLVLSPQTAEPILLFSFRNRIPFAGLSTSWVKAGALYALDRDYADLGAQCGELAVKVLRGSEPKTLPPAYPRKVTYALNLKTAQHMKLELAPAAIAEAQQVFK